MGKGIEVNDNTWSRLTILKARMFAESLNEVIERLLEIGEDRITEEMKGRKV